MLTPTAPGGKITVPVDITNPFYGYRVYVAPELTTSVQHEKDTVSVHPNPVDDFITCSLPYSDAKPADVSIYDLNGRLAKQATIDKDNNTVDLSGLKSGLYVLKLRYGNKVFIRKIIKR